MNENQIDLLRIYWGKDGLSGSINPWVLVGVVILVACIAYRRHASQGREWNATEVEINVPGGGKVKICPNYEVARLAHQAWTELRTRKVALPFDENGDVISEVYDSWYAAFGEIRKIIRSVPAEQIRKSQAAKDLVIVLEDLLNKGMRPHLTKFRAEFSAWEAEASKTSAGLRPQDVQKDFPRYSELVSDLRSASTSIVAFAEDLDMLAHQCIDRK